MFISIRPMAGPMPRRTPRGDGGDDLIADVKNAQQQKDDALHQDDTQHRLEGAGVVRVQHGGHVARDDGEEAVQAHAGEP